MTIVTNRGLRRKRQKPATQAIPLTVPRIVQHTPRGMAWKLPLPDDPEADARVGDNH